jgi:type IV pilus assembly protein PilQ
VAISGNASGAQTLLTTGGFPAASDRFNVNLPVASRAGSLALAFAKLPFGTLLELELSAMQAEGRGEVISSPRVITANQREAYIEQGVEIPYREATSSGAASVSFRKAVLALKVKPQITPDERIIMDLTVNKDSQGQETNGIPAVNTREVSTQVLVANGETLVLGGIYEQTVIQQRNQVPFFGDLPLVGKLFQTNISEDDKSELLVFVTPKIIKDNEGFGN